MEEQEEIIRWISSCIIWILGIDGLLTGICILARSFFCIPGSLEFVFDVSFRKMINDTCER